MKIKSVPILIGVICASLLLIMINLTSIIGDEIADSFSRIVYKPVTDVPVCNDCARLPFVGQGLRIAERKSKIPGPDRTRAGRNTKSETLYPGPCGHDNLLYKKWCEETFDNGSYIYGAYKKIAFNIRYTPELNWSDYWQTPIETGNLNEGDCEDAVLVFFSQITPNQRNVEIIWGWVIDNRNSIGRAHVWCQLTDKTGRKYIVEGFSDDWNGIIPVEIVSENETRKPILTISHCMASRLSRLFPEVDDWKMC